MPGASGAVSEASFCEDTAHHGVIASSQPTATTGRRFVTLLLLAGMVPIPIFALVSRLQPTEPLASSAFDILFLMSVAHGGLSGLFWLDRRYRAHMSKQPRQYYGNIAALASISVISAIILGEAFFRAFSVVYATWNIYHFARQNWGILCLAALGTDSPKPGRLENIACHVACVGGVLGVLPGDVTNFMEGAPRYLGFALVLAGLGLSLVTAVRQFAARADWLRMGMTLSVGGFFLPIYLFEPVSGIATVGTCHAAQYAVIMTTLAVDRKQGSAVFRVAGMLTAAAIYVSLYVVLNRASIWEGWLNPMRVLFSSIVIWHYMTDAGLWRMREPFQRDAIKESFSFLFASGERGERGKPAAVAQAQ